MHTSEDSYGGTPFYRSRKTRTGMQSFSAILLDEIYRSTENNAGERHDSKAACIGKPTKRQTGLKVNKSRGEEEEEEVTARFRLVEKWMEKEAREKFISRRRQEMEAKVSHDNDLLFFSSTSSSSDSSGALSSDTEFFGSSRTEHKVSCFSYRGPPKPIRTAAGEKNRKRDLLLSEDLIKSKSRAMKIYSNLKKVKQPISPGGRLTSFIHTLFTNNANGKKHPSKDLESGKGFRDLKFPNASSSSTTGSSASSLSRSCLAKYPPRSTQGTHRTVQFRPVSVIIDEDWRPCGHKCIDDGDSDKRGRLPLPPHSSPLGWKLRERNGNPDGVRPNASKIDFLSTMEEEEEDCDDGMSDSSSDLFELDHLTFLGNDRFCKQLGLYETTTTHFQL